MEITLPVVLALIMGLSEVAKRLGLNPKWIPVLNLIFGVLFSLAYGQIHPMGTVESILLGVMLGLSASGLYSGVKNVGEGVRGE